MLAGIADSVHSPHVRGRAPAGRGGAAAGQGQPRCARVRSSSGDLVLRLRDDLRPLGLDAADGSAQHHPRLPDPRRERRRHAVPLRLPPDLRRAQPVLAGRAGADAEQPVLRHRRLPGRGLDRRRPAAGPRDPAAPQARHPGHRLQGDPLVAPRRPRRVRRVVAAGLPRRAVPGQHPRPRGRAEVASGGPRAATSPSTSPTSSAACSRPPTASATRRTTSTSTTTSPTPPPSPPCSPGSARSTTRRRSRRPWPRSTPV